MRETAYVPVPLVFQPSVDQIEGHRYRDHGHVVPHAAILLGITHFVSNLITEHVVREFIPCASNAVSKFSARLVVDSLRFKIPFRRPLTPASQDFFVVQLPERVFLDLVLGVRDVVVLYL